MPVQIVEVLRRSEQGVTKPFICRGDDGHTYFVKGCGAGRKSLIAEYICGRLARRLGLPIADFEIVDVPEQLIKAGLLPEINELGSGLAFGSRALPHIQEIHFTHLTKIKPALAKDVLVFDWWIHNQDRTLSSKGGNPNLLWDQRNAKLVVIDHNVAFDKNFDRQAFSENHIFAQYFPAIQYDWVDCTEYQTRLQDAYAEFDRACSDIPHEWWWVDDGVPALFDREETRQVLSRFNQQDFWRIAP
ncbi:HipA family kinase [Undibacterium sp. Di27W]|uniref:HipA family kinase n=1 Tax=Undibacterium sp. Di27W TaxID=3413036 RepID=UPI003BF27B23